MRAMLQFSKKLQGFSCMLAAGADLVLLCEILDDSSTPLQGMQSSVLAVGIRMHGWLHADVQNGFCIAACDAHFVQRMLRSPGSSVIDLDELCCFRFYVALFDQVLACTREPLQRLAAFTAEAGSLQSFNSLIGEGLNSALTATH